LRFNKRFEDGRRFKEISAAGEARLGSPPRFSGASE